MAGSHSEYSSSKCDTVFPWLCSSTQQENMDSHEVGENWINNKEKFDHRAIQSLRMAEVETSPFI